jgi:CelD/BcsL family acetyltransferase involved in cellulose biosynthesis
MAVGSAVLISLIARPKSTEMTDLSRGYSSRVVSPTEITDGERAVWDGLCWDNPHLCSAFYTFSYAQAVAAARPDVFVTVIKRGDEPVGFLPFQFTTRWAKALRAAEPIGGNMTDYFGLIARKDISLTSSELLRLSNLHSLLFTHLDETQAMHGLTGEQPEFGLRIELPAGGEAYWSELRKLDRHFVSDTERRGRALATKLGKLRFQLRSDEAGPLLRHLIEQKRLQYARTGVTDPLSATWKRRLLCRLSTSNDPLCEGTLSLLFAGETWAASHFGLRCNRVLHVWFPVYNQELRAYAPGRLLLWKTITAANEAGIRIIDRGAGETPAKRDFKSVSHHYRRGLWLRPTARALFFRSAMAVKWRAARWTQATHFPTQSANTKSR